MSILKKLSRTDLVKQITDIMDMLRRDNMKTKVIMINRHGNTKSIVKITENDKGAFLYPYEADASEIKMAPIFGSNMHEHTADEILNGLKNMKSEELWLQFPNDGPTTCVGHVTGIVNNNILTVVLFPVNKDIEKINERVHELVSDKCPVARLGIVCDRCFSLATCSILHEADKTVTEEWEKK